MFQTTPEYQPFSLSPTFDTHIPMVRFQLKTGREVALPYFTLGRVDFDPSLQVIELFYGAVVVELHGRHLEVLYGHLTGHQVVVVREATSAEAGILRAPLGVVEGIVLRAAG